MPRVLITVPGKNSQPYRFSLDRKVVRLGRAADNDIIIDCPSVSSHHCEMRRVEGGYTLQDLDSTNGIKADGERMEVLDLDSTVEVEIGDARLDFELNDDERADLSSEPHKSHAKPKLPPSKDKAGEVEEDRPEKPDEIIADEEEVPKKPKKKKRPAPQPARRPAPSPVGMGAPQQPSGAVNFLVTMVFLLLGAAAFYVGMSTRHNAEFGRSLWEDFFGKPAPVEESGDGGTDAAE